VFSTVKLFIRMYIGQNSLHCVRH